MATEWREAPDEVIEIAQRLINKYHPSLQDAGVGFLMRSEAAKADGRPVWGKAKKVPADMQVFVDLDIIIWLAGDVWEQLSEKQRTALIDHELCHIEFEDGKAKMVRHDIEEFNCIIERYGLWAPELEATASAFQASLPMEVQGKDGRVVKVDPDIVRSARELRDMGARFGSEAVASTP